MLFGYRKDGETVITAKHGTSTMYQEWRTALPESDETYVSVRETEFMDKFGDEFGRMRHDVYIFSHKDTKQQDAFIEKHQVTINPPVTAWDRHDTMVDFDAPDYYDVTETRTIEELTGLDTDDRWDRRTDEQKEADQKMKEMIDELKKNGEITNDDSFAPRQKEGEGTAHVDEIRTSIGADGKVQIDNVLATKYGNLRADAKAQTDKDDAQGTPAK